MPEFQYYLNGSDHAIKHIATDTDVYLQRGALAYTNSEADIETPSIVATAIDNGVRFRCTYNYTGEGGTNRIGGLRIQDIILPDAVYINHNQRETQDDPATGPYGHSHDYPRSGLSPLRIVSGSNYTCCVSVHYDVMNDQHDVRLTSQIGTTTGGTAGDHRVQVDFADYSWWVGTAMTEEFGFSSGTKVIDVYIYFVEESKTGRWENSLAAYKAHFDSVATTVPVYPYDLRARAAHFISNTSVSATGNARKFYDGPTGFTGLRADSNGFGPTVDMLIQSGLNWPGGYILWNASGVASNAYDYQFATGTGMYDGTYTNLEDASTEFPRLRAAGHKYVFWHGNSCWLNPTFGGTPTGYLDPSNGTDLATVYDEYDILLDDCQGYGIGLDAYTHAYMRVWDWPTAIAAWRARYPGKEFIFEPPPPDVLLHLAPCYLPADNVSTGARITTGPFKIANKLVPKNVMIAIRSMTLDGFGGASEEVIHEKLYQTRYEMQMCPLIGSVAHRKPRIKLDPGDVLKPDTDKPASRLRAAFGGAL